MNKKDGFVIGFVLGFIFWTIISGFPWSIFGYAFIAKEISNAIVTPLMIVVTVIGVSIGIVGVFKNSAVLGRPWRDYLIFGITAIFDFIYIINLFYLFLHSGVWLLP